MNPQSVHYFAEIPRFASDLETVSWSLFSLVTIPDFATFQKTHPDSLSAWGTLATCV